MRQLARLLAALSNSRGDLRTRQLPDDIFKLRNINLLYFSFVLFGVILLEDYNSVSRCNWQLKLN